MTNPSSAPPHRLTALLALIVLVALLSQSLVVAVPSGASVTYVSNSTAGLGIAGNRSDPRSTITTINLDAVQQDQHWKGYVGNVTGKLSLDDAAGKTIYDWSLTGVLIQGEVYASRNASVTFASMICAAASTIDITDVYLNMTGATPDSVNRTFNGTTHRPFYVGATQLSGCPSIATFVNDLPDTLNSSASFQEILGQDATSNLIYIALINDNVLGFDGTTYDFQMIVPESGVNAGPTPYYFFTELG